MPFEDVALYRALPGSTVIDVTDPTLLASVLGQCVDRPGVKFIRVGRKQYAKVYEEGSELPIGKAVTLREGTDIAIFAAGIMVHEAMQAAKTLEAQGVSAAVIDMFTIKPLDEELVLKAAKECGKVITCEEHSIIGGLGEAVCALLAEKCPTPVRRIGVNDEFGHSGPAAALLKQFGLSAEHIVEVAKNVCGK